MIQSSVPAQDHFHSESQFCLLFSSRFLTDIPICNNGHVQIQKWKSKYKNGRLHCRKLRDERVTVLDDGCQMLGKTG